ncbi:MAG: hypothetical protein HZA28_04440 [Candidatus Omnitrophica bacterium]|nr:hypothetical protein [Candidatus Omnitrophota bacterium]
MNNIFSLFFVLIVIFSLASGFLISRYPAKVIRWQQKFYLLINWRMEPVSMEKEMRNTRWMGLFLIAVTLTASLYYWSCR